MKERRGLGPEVGKAECGQEKEEGAFSPFA